MGRVNFIETRNILSNESCGYISPAVFNTNIFIYMESQNNNICLNKKIAIDREGYIKNCPSMKHSFGNISNTSLKEIIVQTEFNKYWHIAKYQIKVCKDCEFRFICHDCRAYLTDPDDLYSKPLKCGYDPYTNQWNNLNTKKYEEL